MKNLILTIIQLVKDVSILKKNNTTYTQNQVDKMIDEIRQFVETNYVSKGDSKDQLKDQLTEFGSAMQLKFDYLEQKINEL